MYVYLDTAQFSQVFRWASTSSNKNKLFLNDFFQQWNNIGAELCLSLQHVQEISYLDDRKSRVKRLSILQNFKKLHFAPLGWHSVLKNEIVAKLLFFTKGIDPNKWIKEKLWRETYPEFLKEYIERNLGVLRKSHKLYEAMSEFEETFKPIRHLLDKHLRTRRIKDLKNTDFCDLSSIKNIINQLQSMDADDGVSNIFIENIIRAVQETGSLSNALLKLCNIEDLSNAEERYLNDVGSLAVFMKLAHESITFVAKINKVAEDRISHFISRIDPLSCPGFALRMSLLRALHSSNKKYQPSDWKDADHIVYAPYVDIFFVDKRTYTFLQQETRPQPFRLEKSLVYNIRRIIPLEKLIQEISI